MAISLFTGPQDPSQLLNLLNQALGFINGFVSPIPGQSGITRPVQTGTTGTPLPVSGIVNLTTGTGAYNLPKPTTAQLGQSVILRMGSTKAATVIGNFFSSKTKLTFTATAALATVQRLPAIELLANSTSATTAWITIGLVGAVKST